MHTKDEQTANLLAPEDINELHLLLEASDELLFLSLEAFILCAQMFGSPPRGLSIGSGPLKVLVESVDVIKGALQPNIDRLSTLLLLLPLSTAHLKFAGEGASLEGQGVGTLLGLLSARLEAIELRGILVDLTLQPRLRHFRGLQLRDYSAQLIALRTKNEKGFRTPL